MYLSTIVISEFQVKQAINDLPLRNFVVAIQRRSRHVLWLDYSKYGS